MGYSPFGMARINRHLMKAARAGGGGRWPWRGRGELFAWDSPRYGKVPPGLHFRPESVGILTSQLSSRPDWSNLLDPLTLTAQIPLKYFLPTEFHSSSDQIPD